MKKYFLIILVSIFFPLSSFALADTDFGSIPFSNNLIELVGACEESDDPKVDVYCDHNLSPVKYNALWAEQSKVWTITDLAFTVLSKVNDTDGTPILTCDNNYNQGIPVPKWNYQTINDSVEYPYTVVLHDLNFSCDIGRGWVIFGDNVGIEVSVIAYARPQEEVLIDRSQEFALSIIIVLIFIITLGFLFNNINRKPRINKW